MSQNLRIAFLRANLHCSAIKKALEATDGIKLHYDQDTWKRKLPEMKYYLTVDDTHYPRLHMSSRVTDAMIMNPIIAMITDVVTKRGVITYEWKWTSHVPDLGMYPIVQLYHGDTITTLYIKPKF